MFRLPICLLIVCPILAAALGLTLLPPQAQNRGNAADVQPQVADAALTALQARFGGAVQPFLKKYCIDCHSGQGAKGGLHLDVYSNMEAVAKDWRQWETVREYLENNAMPPPKAAQYPTAEQRKEVIAWIHDLRKDMAKRNAGDPGPVLARRLSNAEYDYTIRDLTGVDIRPGKEFPVDPANEAGFDNSSESLTMSPTLLNKYLEAARRVSEHVLLMPDRLTFAEYSVIADTDRDKFGVRQIIDFYKRQRTDYADYFQAAWRFQHRAKLGQPDAQLTDVAAQAGVSAKYLATMWAVLAGEREQAEVGPITALRIMWRELPPPDGKPDTAKAACGQMRDFVVRLRQKLVPDVKNLTAKGMDNGAQPLVLWKNRQMAANRTRYAVNAAKLDVEKLAPNGAVAKLLAAPADAVGLKRYDAEFTRFCAVFPDAFYISERARVYLDQKSEKKLTGRLLSAGFHSMTGYFRDDSPLYDLMLSAEQQQELDRLWLEFDVITGAPIRQYTSFIWFERTDSTFMRSSEFDFARAEDKNCTSEAMMKKLSDVYLAKARKNSASDTAQKAIKDHFEIASANIRQVEKTRLAAESRHVEALHGFAQRAYRRPLAKAERDDLTAFYRSLREKDGLTHEDAVRDVIVSILVSPHFLFRVDRGSSDKISNKANVQPLSDHALASRLSYFLWSTMPDAELLALADAGKLRQPRELKLQARRMLRDNRIRALAAEFTGNWLDFRRFEEHNAVDRQRFKSFNDDLRRAMFEEPIRFVVDVAHNDRPVLDFLFAKHTFVNPALARHYGMPTSAFRTGEKGKEIPDQWLQVDDADKYGRGGLLPMAVFLTKNSPGLRTSPVKRGYWLVSRVLGEKIPPPPAEVPELPADEAKLDLPLRELLVRHRADKNCAACHARFDSFGLAFEGYGPVGERRTKDLGGRLVDTHADFPGGGEGTGLDGLRVYLKQRRQDDFVDNLCRKLLAFALGRTLLPSDDILVEDMRRELAANDYRFGTMIDTVVTSPQFLNRRFP